MRPKAGSPTLEKIHSYRITLEETEAMLHQHPAVQEAVAVAHETTHMPSGTMPGSILGDILTTAVPISSSTLPEEKHLVAYIVPGHDMTGDNHVDLSGGRAVDILGILKADEAYVPLDPDYPEERLEYMLADAGVSLLLTPEALRKQLVARQPGGD